MSSRGWQVLGVVLVALGVLWTGQGLGYIGGSFMTGELTWAVIGPITAAVGALVLINRRRG